MPRMLRVVGGPNNGEWAKWNGEKSLLLTKLQHNEQSAAAFDPNYAPVVCKSIMTQTMYVVRFIHDADERFAYLCPEKYTPKQCRRMLFGEAIAKGELA